MDPSIISLVYHITPATHRRNCFKLKPFLWNLETFCSKLIQMNLLLGVSLSLIFHLFLVLVIFFMPQEWLNKITTARSSLIVEKVKPLDIEIVDEKDHQQIVRSALPPESQVDKSSKEKARFLSEATQRVLIETKAKLSGKTSNNFSTPKYQKELIAKKLEQIQRDFKSPKNEGKIPETSEIPPPTNKKKSDYKPLELYPNEKYGASTLGESLPDDVSVGDFTALNTDQFQFYTFYSRVEDLVRFRWETKIREAMEQLNRSRVLANVSKNEWISEVEFLIDAQGNLRKALILRESGVSRFDQSAIFAFEDAKIFPNPPKEMLRSDGYIHLRYSFHVNYSPIYTAK